MNYYLKQVSLIIILTISTLVVFGQNYAKGKIYDNETGETLPGVTLNTSVGQIAVTDANGMYQIAINPEDMVEISFIGYETLHEKGKNLLTDENVTLYLTPIQQLEEAIITASIASARNRRAIGADVGRVDIAKLMQNNPTTLSDALDGRISGVQLFQSNGKVGMPIRFNMRSGATLSMDRDPLIYVDGVRYNNTHISDINSSQDALSALNDLPMEDIASIEVIKGPAAAASYGSEAANGVIVITTKRASQQTGKVDVNIKFTQGVSTLARKYNQFVNNEPLNEFFEIGNHTNIYANLAKTFSPGNQLYFSLNENRTSGIIPGNTDKRHTFRAAYDMQQGIFSLKAGASYINGDISIPQTAQGRYDAIWNLMRTQEPWQYISERSWRAQSWKYGNDRFIGTLQASLSLPWDIKTETQLGIDNNQIKGTYLLPYGYLIGTNDQGRKRVSDRHNTNLNWDVKVNKRFVFDNNWQVTISLLSQLVRQHETTNVIDASMFSGDIDDVSAASKITASESSFEQRTWGLYSEAFVNYANRLFINAGLRRDASNLIGKNVASIFYPSLSVAYNFNRLKLRTAYGESGRLPYPTDARTSYIMSGNSAYGPIVKPSTKGNADIRPERMREIEAGIEANLGNHQLSLTGYAQYTTDAIIYVPLQSSHGWVGTIAENVGKVEGHGIEFSWNGTVWQNISQKHALSLFATVSYQKNRVTDVNGRIIDNYPNVIRKDEPAYAFYYLKVEGAKFDDKGVYKGAVESSEPTYLGKPFPDFNGAFGFDLRLFRDLTLGCKFSYATGASVYNQSFYNVAGLGNNLKKREDLLQAIKLEQPGTDAYNNMANKLAYTERMRSNYIEKADYLRLSTISVGYDLSRILRNITKNTIQGCQFNFSIQNVFLTTNYSGAEPLVESNGGTRQTRGIGTLSRDITNAPTPRTYMASLSLNF